MTTSERLNAAREAKELILSIDEHYWKTQDIELMEIIETMDHHQAQTVKKMER